MGQAYGDQTTVRLAVTMIVDRDAPVSPRHTLNVMPKATAPIVTANRA